MPQDLRKRIDVIAIAPAAYIDRELCRSRFHYVSWDLFPFIDYGGYLRNKDSVYMIKPHPNAKLVDHNFDSPLYTEFLNYHIKKYIN